MEIGSKVEHLHYCCNGIEEYQECDHVLPISVFKNNWKKHRPEANLITTEGCPGLCCKAVNK